jgi:hypothetical protein
MVQVSGLQSQLLVECHEPNRTGGHEVEKGCIRPR